MTSRTRTRTQARTRIGVGAALVVAGATAVTVGAGGAVAADGNTTTTLYTLAREGFCAGTIDAGVGHYPGQAVLFLGTRLYGVGTCKVDVTFTFTPRSGGASTSFTRHVPGPGDWGTSKDIVSPGKAGIYDVTVRTDAPSVGARPMTIDITKYPG